MSLSLFLLFLSKSPNPYVQILASYHLFFVLLSYYSLNHVFLLFFLSLISSFFTSLSFYTPSAVSYVFIFFNFFAIFFRSFFIQPSSCLASTPSQAYVDVFKLEKKNEEKKLRMGFFFLKKRGNDFEKKLCG